MTKFSIDVDAVFGYYEAPAPEPDLNKPAAVMPMPVLKIEWANGEINVYRDRFADCSFRTLQNFFSLGELAM